MSRDWLDKNFYATLGVPQNATKEEIKTAYKKLARDNHPDLNPDNPEAERKFKEVSEAHAVLGDDRKRQEYDQIRTIRFANTSSTTGTQLYIRATGANALDVVFNSQTGNLKISPRTAYTYSDYLSETPVDASNRYLYVHNDGNENVTYNLITMGISNAFTGTTDQIPTP